MAIDYAALKAELNNDPAAMGYAVHIANGSDHLLAQLLNAPKVGVNVPVGIIPAETVAAALDGTELAALTTAQRDTIRVYLTPGSFDATPGSAGRTYLLGLFPQGTTTRTNMLAMVDRLGSRAEELGFDRVSDVDVAIALRDPAYNP